MRPSTAPPPRSAVPPVSISAGLHSRIVGQNDAIDTIVPYVELYNAGLAPEGRPVGIFLLLGPTGSGKTKTVEALADVLHGSEKSVLTINCGEFQMEHEVAKLIGAPPGYLGHRETYPILTQHKLSSCTSSWSALSLVLFDEIEKAAPSMTRLLLGVLDKGTLQLGDNTTVNFDHSMIFMTSNLGARELESALTKRFGLAQGSLCEEKHVSRITRAAVKKRFSPEFMNRIDQVLTYSPLTSESIAKILAFQIEELNRHLAQRLGPLSFTLSLDSKATEFLLKLGVSPEYGARELKRVVHRHVLQALPALVQKKVILPGAGVTVSVQKDTIIFTDETGRRIEA